LDPYNFIVAPGDIIQNRQFANKVLDESVIIHKRIQNNYGVDTRENIEVLRMIQKFVQIAYPNSEYLKQFLDYQAALRDCWSWLRKCCELRKAPIEMA